MTRKVIEPVRNEHVFVDVKRCCDSLRKHVSDIIVGVRPVVEVGSKCSLPLLGLHNTLSVGRMEKETLKLQFSDSPDRRSHFESQISVGLIGIHPFDESHFRIEVGPNFSAFEYPLHPLLPLLQTRPAISIPTTAPR